MIIKIIVGAVSILFLKTIYNLYYYFLTKRYYKKYTEFVKGQKSWFIREHRQKIVSLFNGAGIKDSFQPNTEQTGYGMLATSTFSVFQNISVLREDIIEIINGDFHEVIGVYKQRMLESFNPFYWIESFFQLPRVILEYLGVSPKSVFIKIFQVVWWIIMALSTLVGIFFNSEFAKWVSNL